MGVIGQPCFGVRMRRCQDQCWAYWILSICENVFIQKSPLSIFFSIYMNFSWITLPWKEKCHFTALTHQGFRQDLHSLSFSQCLSEVFGPTSNLVYAGCAHHWQIKKTQYSIKSWWWSLFDTFLICTDYSLHGISWWAYCWCYKLGWRFGCGILLMHTFVISKQCATITCFCKDQFQCYF